MRRHGSATQKRSRSISRRPRSSACEDIGTGVTNPKRAELAPGGPVAEIAWKPIRSGYYRGHYESYQAEIAAYELDRLLGLNMVPVTVEKRIEGALGAASMWVSARQ